MGQVLELILIPNKNSEGCFSRQLLKLAIGFFLSFSFRKGQSEGQGEEWDKGSPPGQCGAAVL